MRVFLYIFAVFLGTSAALGQSFNATVGLDTRVERSLFSGDFIGTAKKDEIVEVSSCVADYCLITFEGQNGWIAATSISVGGVPAREFDLDQRLSSPLISDRRIAMWGDSLAELVAPELGRMLGRTVFNGGVGGEEGRQIGKRMKDDQVHKGWATIIWDRSGTGEPTDHYLTPIAEMADLARASNDHFIIISDIPKMDSTEAPGTRNRSAIDAKNDAMRAKYPGHFIDITSLVDERRLRIDGLHFTPEGTKIVARAIADFIQTKGW